MLANSVLGRDVSTSGGSIDTKLSIAQTGQNSTISMKPGERASRFNDKKADQIKKMPLSGEKVWIAVVTLSSLLSLVTLLLLGHLLSFHLYLCEY